MKVMAETESHHEILENDFLEMLEKITKLFARFGTFPVIFDASTNSSRYTKLIKSILLHKCK